MDRTVAGVGTIVIAVVLLAGCSGSDDDGAEPTDVGSSARASDSATATDQPTTTPTSDPDPRRPPTPVDVPPEVAEDATDSAAGYTEVVADALGDPGADLSGQGAVAGVALEALQAQADEYERSGWRIEGQPRVVSVDVYEHEEDRMLVGACVDNSAVRVLDQAGDVVSDGADLPPTLNIFTLSLRDADWVVVDISFPADPDC